LVQQTPNVGYVYTQLRYFEASTKASHYPAFDLKSLKKENVIPASIVIKSAVAKRFKYDVRYHVLEDWDFYLTLAEHGIMGALLDDPIFLYRIHSDRRSALNKSMLRGVLKTRRNIILKHRKLYGPVGWTISEIRYFGLKSMFALRDLRPKRNVPERGLDPLG
jgi:hypothetical protein